MKPFEEQLRRLKQEITLTETERKLMREHVHAYMKYHRSTPTKDRAHEYSFAGVPLRFVVSSLASIVIVFSLSVSSLAESAYPGDALYPIKVSVNEKVYDVVRSVSGDSVSWNTERLMRRLDEVAVLSQRDTLTPQARDILILALRHETETLEAKLREVETTAPEVAREVRTELAVTISAYQDLVLRTESGGVSEGEAYARTAMVREFDEASLKLGLADGGARSPAPLSMQALPAAKMVGEGGMEMDTGVTSTMELQVSSDAPAPVDLETAVDQGSIVLVQKKIASVQALLLDVKTELSESMYVELRRYLERISLGFTEGGVDPYQTPEELLVILTRLEVYVRTLKHVGGVELPVTRLDEFVPEVFETDSF